VLPEDSVRTRALGYLLAALVVASCAGLAVVCGISALEAQTRPFPGFLMYSNGAITSLMRHDWQGPDVGLLPRDVVRAVDGKPVTSGAEAHAMIDRHQPGDLATIEIERPGESAHRVMRVTVGRLRASDFGFVFVMPFAIGVLYLALGAVVFFVKRSRAAALVLSLCLVAAVFHLTMFDAHWSYRFTRLWVCYPLLGPLSIHVFSVFPEERRRLYRPLTLLPIYAGGVVLIVLRQIYLGEPFRFDLTSLFAGILLATCFLGDIVLLAYTWLRTKEPAARSKARTMTFGLVVTITLAVVWSFLSRFGPRHVTADQAMMLSALFPILISYATVRQNLFDLDAVLQKSLTYGAISALVLGVYVAIVAIASAVLSPMALRWSPFASPALTAIVSTIILMMLASPLRNSVQRTVNRIFYSETVDVRRALVELGKDLEKARAPWELGERVATQLVRALDLRGAALLVWQPQLSTLGRAGDLGDLAVDEALEKRLQVETRPVRAVDDVLVPLPLRGRAVGAVALSPRHGHELGAADLELVTALAPTLAIAVENAELVAERAGRERLAALGGVAAVIVHEVKNPLGIIRVSASTLEKKFGESDSGRELAQCIVEEVDRMDATLRQILSFARPQPPALAQCDVRALIERTCARMRPELEAAKVHVATDLDGAPPVQADLAQLERVLVNLLKNATAAMTSGGAITITTRPVRRLLGGRAVEITVADTGCGMDEATRRRLFEPFFTTRPGGTGLGLAIVKQILDEHHGEIAVESEPGKGTVFRITLPA
jgi:signal transduction histidine kinase